MTCLCFFCARFLNICRPCTTLYLIWWVGLPELRLYGWWKQTLSVPCVRKFSRKWCLSVFQAVPLNGLSHLPDQPALYNQLLIQSLFLAPDAILHKMLKLGFWNFKPIFLRMQFLLVATFFASCGYLFELIFAS